MSDIEEMVMQQDIDSLIEEVIDLRSEEPEDFQTDEFRQWENSVKEKTNQIETILVSVIQRGFNLLDKDLDIMVQSGLDKKIIEGLEDRGLQHELKERLEDRKKLLHIQARQEEERKQFIEYMAFTFQRLKTKPDKYIVKGEGEVVVNPAYELWKKTFLTLRKRVESKVKAETSLERDLSDYEADKRQSIFVMKKKLDEIYSENEEELKQTEEKKSVTRLMSEETQKLQRMVYRTRQEVCNHWQPKRRHL